MSLYFRYSISSQNFFCQFDTIRLQEGLGMLKRKMWASGQRSRMIDQHYTQDETLSL